MELPSFDRPDRGARRQSPAFTLLWAFTATHVLAASAWAQLDQLPPFEEPTPNSSPWPRGSGAASTPYQSGESLQVNRMAYAPETRYAPQDFVPSGDLEAVPPPPPLYGYGVTTAPGNAGQPGVVPPPTQYGVISQAPPSMVEEEAFEPCYEPIPTGFEGSDDEWGFHLMPKSLIWHSYLAGPWEPRFASVWSNDRYRGWEWDVALGGRVGLCRWGSKDCAQPSGWELQMEGAAFPRLDPMSQVDLEGTDYRFGMPVVYGNGPYQMKIGFWHISSHVGDELLLRDPSVQRINFGRNALAWGHSYYANPDLRVYGEIDFAWDSMYSETWNFQFGFDWAPILQPGNHRAPFVAVNVHLREELDYSGSFNAQAGFAWRHGADRRMFRLGIQYYDGGNQQFSFYKTNESKVGLGLWYDY